MALISAVFFIGANQLGCAGATEGLRLTTFSSDITPPLGEPMLAYQFYAQGLRPDGFVAVAGYGDGGPGYICPAQAFTEGGYEPTASNIKPESEVLVKKAIAALLGVEEQSAAKQKLAKLTAKIRSADIHPPGLYDTDPQRGVEKVREVVRLAAECNLNVLRPFAVGPRCDASYQSKIVPIMLFPDWDPLKVLIDEAHARSIKVYPIVCVVPQGAEDLMKPGSLGPVLKEHPQWALANREGQLMGWGNPAHPEFRKYAVSVIMEIVEHYDIDGITLDYARYPVTKDGYCEYNRKKFKELHGVDPLEITNKSPLRGKWTQWQIDQLTVLVKEIHDAVKKAKPQLLLSAYVWRPKEGCLRDWQDWLRKGYLDIINPSGYSYEYPQYLERCQTAVKAARAANPNVPVIINIGVSSSKGRLKNTDQIVKWAEGAGEAGADGFSFFTFNTLVPLLSENIARK